VTDFLIEANPKRGRQFELNRIEAGTCQLKLDNSDRRFDPTNASSTYYPNVLPERKARLSVTVGGQTWYLFTGYVERWPIAWDQPNYSEIEVELSDAFEPMSLAEIDGVFPQERTGARINRVLDLIGWPAADRAVDAGLSFVQAVTIPADGSTLALGHMQDVADTELGSFFIDGRGFAVFYDRAHRLKAPYTTPRATFDDQANESATVFNFTDLKPAEDKDLIANDWRVTRTGGVQQVAADQSSQAIYFKRTQTRSPLFPTDAESLDQARFLLSQYKNPSVRIAGLDYDLLPTTTVIFWELGDRMTIKATPPAVPGGGSGRLIQDVCVEHIEHKITTDLWQILFELSPASTTTYWVLGDSVAGLLGQTTTLAY
jgi:hypothetical protein